MRPRAAVRRRWPASAFAPVLANPVLRRLLPALAVSAIGDGMSAVGVAWLAIRIASPADRGLVVGVAVGLATTAILAVGRARNNRNNPDDASGPPAS